MIRHAGSDLLCYSKRVAAKMQQPFLLLLRIEGIVRGIPLESCSPIF